MLEIIGKLIQNTAVQVVALSVLGVLLYVRKRMQRALQEPRQDPDGVPLDDELAAEIYVATKIADCLTEIRLGTKATRAYVFQFHNGDVYTNGSGILRMSAAHESIARGVSSIMRHCCHVLVSTVREAVEFLVSYRRGDPPKYTETSDVESGYYKNILMNSGVMATIQFPLYRAADIIGYLGVDFDNINAAARKQNKAAEAQYQKDLQVKLNFVASKVGGVEYWVNKKGESGSRSSWWRRIVRKLS